MRYPHKVYGWDSVNLSDLTLTQLNELRDAIIENPANREESGVHLYTRSARSKLDALSWAVYHKSR